MMNRMFRWPAALTLALAIPAGGASAQKSAADFYRTNSIRFPVAAEPGRAFDVVARAFAKYLSRHLPGQPNVVVTNMPGGGGTIMANWCYNSAPRDGSVICMPLSTMPINQVIAPGPVRYDATKVRWIGNLEKATDIIVTWHTSKTKTMQEAMRRETPMSATGKNSIIYEFIALANHIAGTKFKPVLGYTTGRFLAVERGEVDGTVTTLQILPTSNPTWTAKDYQILVINAPRRLPKYPNVPTLIEFAKTPQHRQMLEFWMEHSSTARAIFTPPDVPADRVAVLRQAFDKVAKDPAFLAEAARFKTVIEPDSGAEVQESVRRLVGTAPEVAAAMVELFK